MIRSGIITQGGTLAGAAACSVCFWRLLCLRENLHHGRRLLCHLETGRQWELWWVHESAGWVTAFFSLMFHIFLFGKSVKKKNPSLSSRGQAWALPPGRSVTWPNRLWSSARRATRWRSAPRAPSKTQRSPSSWGRSLTKPPPMTGTAK